MNFPKIFGKTLVSRYFLISFAASVLPLLVMGKLYDDYVKGLLNNLTGETLAAQQAATASRISAFFEGRIYQLETLSNHPAMSHSLADRNVIDPEVGALLRLEADSPDLYGILFFAPDGALSGMIAGQAASGAPYWPPDSGLRIDGLPRTGVEMTEIIGPAAPAEDQPGWILLRQPLRDQESGTENGSIALHVRLASVTELLGSPSAAGLIQPVLIPPGGQMYNAVGWPVRPEGEMLPGPEVLPGWRTALFVEPDQFLAPLRAARQWLALLLVVSALAVVVLFSRLSRRLRDRVGGLVNGANAVSAGDLHYRLTEAGRDEITTVSQAFNRMAEKLRQMVDRTVRVEKMALLGEFATGVAHEVRNPLASIKISVQALARQERDGEKLEILTGVASEIDRLGRVVEDLLSYGRPHPPEATSIAVADVFRQAEGLLIRLAQAQGVRIDCETTADLLLLADRAHIVQILVNLLLNALQATRAGDVITLRGHRQGEAVILRIGDTGCGIAPDLLPRVTEPFVTTKPQGTGLGLSICRQLAELNGGTLDIASQPGHGTQVTLRLPACVSSDPTIAQHDQTIGADH